MKTYRRRDKAIIALAIIALLSTLILWVFHMKPDWRYIVTQAVTTTFRQGVKLEEKDIEVSEIPISQIADSSSFIVNQSMMLVNKDNPVDEDFEAEIVTYNLEGPKMNRCMIKAFEQLCDDVQEECNENLYVMSAYRTAQEQAEIYDEQGSDTAEKPGSSEHQTGLALDVYAKYFAGSAFLKSQVGRYVNSHCWEHGFIIRYPFMKSNITGIDYEPWHLRYVGLPHSEIISKNNMVLEEYINLFEDGRFYKYGDYLISHQRGDVLKMPVEFFECVVSPDNMGGYFITAKII